MNFIELKSICKWVMLAIKLIDLLSQQSVTSQQPLSRRIEHTQQHFGTICTSLGVGTCCQPSANPLTGVRTLQFQHRHIFS